MLTFSTSDLRDIVKQAHPDDAAVAEQVNAIDFLEFGSLEESVKSDVKFLQENPLVLKETTITGWIYEAETGKVSHFSTFCFVEPTDDVSRLSKSCETQTDS